MSHVRVTIEARVCASSSALPDLVSIALRPLEGDEPLSTGRLDTVPENKEDASTVKVGVVSDGSLEVCVEAGDVIRAVTRGLRARLEAPVFRGEQIFLRAGHAPE